MPELPDLEVFKRNLCNKVIDKEIINVGVNATKAIIGVTPSELTAIAKGQTFVDVSRRGKHLIFELSNEKLLITHLMLHGRFEYGPIPQDHALSDCVWLNFADGNELKITDRTRWIKVEVLDKSHIENSKLLKGLGPEADEVSLTEFTAILKKSRLGRIKPLLMDQKKIAGIGNAYVDEMLWKSKIHPDKTASLLTDPEIQTLHSNILPVLKWGIEQSAKDVGKELKESSRKWMNVYRKEGQPCPICNTTIKYTKVNQRDTFYCPTCQTK
jgi:formamidopyrimidine-DNA glycosylase